MDLQEITSRNQVLKELMLSAAQREFWTPTIEMTEQSMAAFEKEAWLAKVDTAFVVGHGTSLATSQNASSYLSHIAGIASQALPAFEFASHPDDYIKRPHSTLVIGISCGGNTASVVNSLRAASERGCETLCLSGEGDIGCAKAAKWRMITDCQIEQRGNCPHPYSVSHLFLLLGAYKLAILLGKRRDTLSDEEEVYWNHQLSQALDSLKCLPALFERMGEVAQTVRSLSSKNQVVLGSGPNHGTMFEGALKICEFSWRLGAGEELEDFAHGRFREMDEETPLLIISPKGSCCNKTMDILAGAAIANTNTIVLTDAATPAMRKMAKCVVDMPALEDEYLTPFLYVFALWFYGYHLKAQVNELVGEARYGLYATDINFQAHFDAEGNRL